MSAKAWKLGVCKMTSLLPGYESSRVREFEAMVGERFAVYADALADLSRLYDPMSVRADFLPVLARAFRVDFWDDNLSEAEKRGLVMNALRLHRHKGTRWAVETVLKLLGVEGDVVEWFESSSLPPEMAPTEPYTFTVVARVLDTAVNAGVVLSPEAQARLVKLVRLYKNARSHFELFLSALFDGAVAVGATGCRVWNVRRVSGGVHHEPQIGWTTKICGTVNARVVA